MIENQEIILIILSAEFRDVLMEKNKNYVSFTLLCGNAGEADWENNIFDLCATGFHRKLIRMSDSRQSNVQLAMTEYVALEKQSDFFKCLALAFVDCHGKSQLYGELSSS